jgi:hypothetical protein
VQATQTLAAGANITLRLAGLPDLPAQVLQDGQEVGLQFPWDPGASPPELQNWLAHKAAA